MSQLCHLARCLQRRNAIFKTNVRAIIQSVLLSSSSSDDEKKSQRKVDQKKRSEDALNKLNNLLKTMIEEDVSVKTKLNLAKPTDKRKRRDKKEETESPKVESPEKQILNAVKHVAESIGGNVKQTESELLMKLLNPLSEDKTSNLSDIVKGMKIDKESAVGDQSRAHQIRQILEQVEQSGDSQKSRAKPSMSRPIMATEKIDLFGSEPLDIFTDQSEATEGVQNKTWAKLYERDLKLAVIHPPSNYFQQMILWTEQGKVWKFPIDNEKGLEEEQKVYFTEHVFLEKHLEPWCPQKGPIRHFMELVCVGLSKNPYLTVEAKKEHIGWFNKYFEDKKQLLREVGALQEHDLGDTNIQKQIE